MKHEICPNCKQNRMYIVKDDKSGKQKYKWCSFCGHSIPKQYFMYNTLKQKEIQVTKRQERFLSLCMMIVFTMLLLNIVSFVLLLNVTEQYTKLKLEIRNLERNMDYFNSRMIVQYGKHYEMEEPE